MSLALIFIMRFYIILGIRGDMYLIQINKAIIINSRTVRAIEPKTIVGTKLSKSIPRLSATSSLELFESESSYV